jgi:KUP system potassium uptake protein
VYQYGGSGGIHPACAWHCGILDADPARRAPPVMVWHAKHNRALHEKLFVLTATTESVPWVEETERLKFEEIAPRFWRAAARYGFMERPDIPALLQHAHGLGCAIDLSDITYYVGHETVVPGDAEKALPRVVEALFAFMQRNSAHLTEYFRLPTDAPAGNSFRREEFPEAEPSVKRG